MGRSWAVEGLMMLSWKCMGFLRISLCFHAVVYALSRCFMVLSWCFDGLPWCLHGVSIVFSGDFVSSHGADSVLHGGVWCFHGDQGPSWAAMVLSWCFHGAFMDVHAP